MLTANQLCVLYPQHVNNQLNNISKKRSPKRCLFGPPDPLENRRLFEEQFLADRELMLRKYSFDILTSRPVRNLRSADTIAEGESLADPEDVEDNFLIPAGFPLIQTTNEEAGQRRCSPESEVRHRPGRHSPYNRQTRQTRITGNGSHAERCEVSCCKYDVARHMFVARTKTSEEVSWCNTQVGMPG